MFYKIDDNYYVLVGNKYVQVKFEVKDGDINPVPLDKKIERDAHTKAIAQPFNEEFKKSIINKNKPQRSLENKEENDDEPRSRSRFGR